MQAFEKAIGEFERLDAQVLGISVDNKPSKKAWAEAIEVKSFPLLSDFWPHGDVAKRYGVLRDTGTAARAVFVVNKQGIITFSKVYPSGEVPPMDEILEAVKSTT